MIWLDRHGQGLLIRDFGEDDTKYLPDLRDREYFQVWQRDYPASRRPPPLPDSGALLLNTSRVWSVLRWGRQGEKGAVLTVPGWLGHKGQAEPILGLYATQLTCLTNPILPPGFSFCVLDGQGNVQFHSDDRLSLSENLLQDGEPGSTISAALLSQVPTQASIYYQGHRYRMRLEPMRADQGYFLLVLADEENLRSRQLHILVRAALLLGGVAGVTLGLMGLLQLAQTRRGRRLRAHNAFPRLWPQPRHRRHYVQITLAGLGGLGLLFFVSCHTAELTHLFPLKLLFPVEAVSIW